MKNSAESSQVILSDRRWIIVLCIILVLPTFLEAMIFIDSNRGMLWAVAYSLYHFPLWVFDDGFFLSYSPEFLPLPEPPGRLLVTVLYLISYFSAFYIFGSLKKGRH